MRKKAASLVFCFALAAAVWLCALASDKQTLRQELVRLHVVAASDSAEDQAMKLHLKDALVESLQQDLQHLQDSDAAMAYLEENLPKIEALANRILREAGCEDTASVRLAVEEFSTRVYDTFALPAGLYDTLRVTVGEGAGQNWWCVVFPALCLSTTAEGFEEAASCAGFSYGLTQALEGNRDYEIRFWILDTLGQLENFLHRE